jgi:lipopolysaccharide transport system ATP-binding protein
MSDSPLPLLKLENVGVRYQLKRRIGKSNDYWALQDVSLTIHQGETLGVLGSNGAGKSTLMKILAGIIAPDRGKLWRDPRFSIALLSLGVGFESSLTGRENAILSGLLLGLHRKTISKRLDRIRDFSELGDFFEQPVYTYSSGMVSRLGFSVAMEADPDILLLDEVLSVGDTAFRKKSFAALDQRLKSNKTVVLISHDFETIERICQRAVWMDHGRTKCEGTVEAVRTAYRTAAQEVQSTRS